MSVRDSMIVVIENRGADRNDISTMTGDQGIQIGYRSPDSQTERSSWSHE